MSTRYCVFFLCRGQATLNLSKSLLDFAERNTGFPLLCRVASPQAARGGLEMLCPGAAAHLASAECCLQCLILLQAVGKEADCCRYALFRGLVFFPLAFFFLNIFLNLL